MTIYSSENPSDRPLRVAAYIRVSTDSKDQENSYRAQERYFSTLISRNPHWINAGIYSDYAISGTGKDKRPGYLRMLRHCQRGRLDRIICKSISRFARNTIDFITSLELLQAHHVTILFEKEGLDTRQPISTFVLTALGAIAQEESRSISANITWGIQRRFPKGQARNYAIYGYRSSSLPLSSSPESYPIRPLEIIEDEAKVVRRIFQAVAAGISYMDIARTLNREGISPPPPNPGLYGRYTAPNYSTGWTGDMIAHIISMERYCGDVLLQKTYTPSFLTHKRVKNKGERPQYMVYNHHPAIVDRELFNRVLAVREHNRLCFTNTSPGRRDRPLTGRLVCPNCGRYYNVRNPSNPLWFCPSTALNNNTHLCHSPGIYESQVMEILSRAITIRFPDILSPSAHSLEKLLSLLDAVHSLDFVERERSFLYSRLNSSHPLPPDRLSLYRTRLEHLDLYIEELEKDYAERDKAFIWLNNLVFRPDPRKEFLQLWHSQYLRAFVLTIYVYSPDHLCIRWFDDTHTQVNIKENLL